jgi:sarcosine oxidase, subunit beta
LKSAEVVIIGGGVIGASAAYHLAARGCRDVLILERGAQPGGGSTGRATGGFRAQFGTEVNVRLSLLSRDKLLNFAAEHGVDPCFRQYGYLFLASGRRELEALRAAREVQRVCGLRETREVGPEEAARLNPAVNPGGIVGGSFCPADGFMRPLEILRGYTESAARLGVRVEYGRSVEGLRRGADGRIERVVTAGGEIPCGSVVNAAGAWAARVASLAGVQIPVTPLRRQVALTEPCDLLPEEMPMTVFTDDGFHLRVRDGRVLLLWPDDPRLSDPFDTTTEDEWLAVVQAKARRRLPCLSAAEIDRAGCWAGLYEMTPDKHALLGRAPGVDNFYLVNGSSGHGVMHAPALGQLLAEIILDGAAATLDVHRLRPERFAEGDPNPAPDFL